MAHNIIERVEACYEVREVPFGKVYEWHPAYLSLECDCGEQLLLTSASITTACSCGAEVGAFVYNLREREDRLPDRLTHPWFYDAKEQEYQHQQDEAVYPEGSPWRYNDVTADGA
jgi:hypothetical protein